MQYLSVAKNVVVGLDAEQSMDMMTLMVLELDIPVNLFWRKPI